MNEQEPKREIPGVSAPANTMLTEGLTTEQRLKITNPEPDAPESSGKHIAEKPGVLKRVMGALSLGRNSAPELPPMSTESQLPPITEKADPEIAANLNQYETDAQTEIDEQATADDKVKTDGLAGINDVDKDQAA